MELSRQLLTSQRAQKVVARSPPTEESNLNAPLRERKRSTGCGYHNRVCRVCAHEHVQRAGRHACVHGGPHPSAVVHRVEVDVPSSCGDARAPGRAAGLRATSLLKGPASKDCVLISNIARVELSRVGWKGRIPRRASIDPARSGRRSSPAAEDFLERLSSTLGRRLSAP